MKSYYNPYGCEIIRTGINYKKFSELPDSEYDYKKFERSFSGRMTKKRWQLINSFCRRMTYRVRVCSDYDCTGRFCGQSMEFEYKHNQVVVRLNMSYDY